MWITTRSILNRGERMIELKANANPLEVEFYNNSGRLAIRVLHQPDTIRRGTPKFKKMPREIREDGSMEWRDEKEQVKWGSINSLQLKHNAPEGGWLTVFLKGDNGSSTNIYTLGDSHRPQDVPAFIERLERSLDNFNEVLCNLGVERDD